MPDSVSASAKGALLLILQQFGSRALTFAANQLLLRYLSPELFGLSAQLELFSISSLYFSRESLRVALQRQATGSQTVVNLAYLSTILGSVLSFLLGSVYARADSSGIPFLRETLFVYIVATCIELCAEPAFAVAQQKLLYNVRASAESIGNVARCLIVCALAIWSSKADFELGPLPFAAGQLAYAFSVLFVYTYYIRPIAVDEKFSLTPKVINKSDYIFGYFARTLCNLAGAVFLQSSIKYILTQGDSILVVSLASLREQGAYALASNYGGLIARLVFQPIEESSRNLFAKLCAPSGPKNLVNTKDLQRASQLLLDILKFYALISLLAFSFGPSLAPELLRLLAGSRWSETGAGEVLGSYCYYIPLLALNGVTEAFVAAVAPISTLRKQSVYMTGFFVAFAGSAYIFLAVWKLGAQGLVFANCVNMLLRIIWNLSFVHEYFNQKATSFEVSRALPSAFSVLGAVISFALLSKIPAGIVKFEQSGQLMWGAFCILICLISMVLSELRYAKHLYSMIRTGKAE